MTALGIFKASSLPEDSLLATMAVDVAVNEKSGVWVLHDRPFESDIRYIEYRAASAELIFHGNNGRTWPLGMKVPARTQRKMQNAARADLYYIPDGKRIEGYKRVPLIQRSST